MKKFYVLTHDGKLDSVGFMSIDEAIHYLENRIPRRSIVQRKDWTINYISDKRHSWKIHEIEVV